MTGPSDFDQKGQSVNTQTNIGHADKVIIDQSRPLPVPHQIPPQPADFIGREDEIEALLEKFGQGATITGLRGLGGVGKTALALVLADRLKNRFQDGQLFLNMQGTSKTPLKPEDAMAHVIRSYLGADAPLPKGLNGLSGLYQTVLSGKKALILLDNAASREQVEPLLPPKGCGLLVTSRNKFALPGLTEKDLNVLLLDEAKELLLEICGRIGDHAEELAKLYGCLPIALRNAASILREKPNLSVANYLKRLGDARERLELVEASFSLSYDLLTPELQRLWSLLSVFPADFDLAGAAAVWEMEDTRTEDSLGELIRWSLVDFLPSATGEWGRYRLHDLARDFAGSHLDEAVRELAILHHAEYYRDVLSEAEECFLQGKEGVLKGLQLFDQERANILAGQSWAEKNLEGNSSAAIDLCKSYPNAGVYVLNLRLSPTERISWLKTALEASEKSGDKLVAGYHLGNLGVAYSHLGDPRKAIGFYEKALAISREIGDRPGEGAHLGNLGNAYSHLDNPRKAIDFQEEALAIFREIGNLRGEGASLGSLGLAYYYIGDPKKAIDLHEEALSISREIGDRHNEGAHVFNMSLSLRALGQNEKAVSLAKSALAIFEEIESPNAETVRKTLAEWGD